MCRHFGVLSREPVPLAEPLFDADQSLERQSFAPAHQEVGTVNADGWGVGWWDHAIRAEPARYRTTTPIWADRRFREIAPLLSSTSMVAAVRNVTVGAPSEESGNAPFVSGSWLFSHNGFVEGFRDGLGVELRRSLRPARDAEILGASDSEVLFALVLDRIDDGVEPTDAVASVVTDVAARADGRLNLLLSDGRMIVATRWGNELATLDRAGQRWIASEPLDDGPWRVVPDRTLLTVTLSETTCTPL